MQSSPAVYPTTANAALLMRSFQRLSSVCLNQFYASASFTAFNEQCIELGVSNGMEERAARDMGLTILQQDFNVAPPSPPERNDSEQRESSVGSTSEIDTPLEDILATPPRKRKRKESAYDCFKTQQWARADSADETAQPKAKFSLESRRIAALWRSMSDSEKARFTPSRQAASSSTQITRVEVMTSPGRLPMTKIKLLTSFRETMKRFAEAFEKHHMEIGWFIYESSEGLGRCAPARFFDTGGSPLSKSFLTMGQLCFDNHIYSMFCTWKDLTKKWFDTASAEKLARGLGRADALECLSEVRERVQLRSQAASAPSGVKVNLKDSSRKVTGKLRTDLTASMVSLYNEAMKRATRKSPVRWRAVKQLPWASIEDDLRRHSLEFFHSGCEMNTRLQQYLPDGWEQSHQITLIQLKRPAFHKQNVLYLLACINHKALGFRVCE